MTAIMRVITTYVASISQSSVNTVHLHKKLGLDAAGGLMLVGTCDRDKDRHEMGQRRWYAMKTAMVCSIIPPRAEQSESISSMKMVVGA